MVTGLSKSIDFSFCKIPNTEAVKALVQEPIANCVLAVTGNLFSTSRYPKPLAKMTLFFSTTATATPAAWLSFNILLISASMPTKRLSTLV